jgi:hypothetical protein
MGKDAKSSNRVDEAKSKETHRDSEQSKSRGVLNKPFDEALEFSQSGSDDSVDTRKSQTKGKTESDRKKSVSDFPELKDPQLSSSYLKSPAAPLQNNILKQPQVEKLVRLHLISRAIGLNDFKNSKLKTIFIYIQSSCHRKVVILRQMAAMTRNHQAKKVTKMRATRTSLVPTIRKIILR